MTEAMPFLQKAILLSYDPRPFCRGLLLWIKRLHTVIKCLWKMYGGVI